MKKSYLIVILVIIILVGLGAFYLMQPSKTAVDQVQQSDLMTQTDSNQMEQMDMTPAPPSESTPSTTSASPQMDGEVKVFTMDAQNFSFSLKEIRVKKGDRVRIVMVNKQGFHDWVIDEFNAKTAQVNAGQTVSVEFVADQVGTFQFYCSVGRHRQMGMVGNLIVEE